MSEAFAVNAKKEETKKLQYYIHTPPPLLKKLLFIFGIGYDRKDMLLFYYLFIKNYIIAFLYINSKKKKGMILYFMYT